jgi:hypothetical protein
MNETRVESLLRQIKETKLYIAASERELLNLQQRLEAFELLLKEEEKSSNFIDLTGRDF